MTKPKISWPQTPADVRQFIGSSFDSFSYGDKETRSPHIDDRYCISAHDLLTAFSDWVEFLCEPEPQPQQEPEAWMFQSGNVLKFKWHRYDRPTGEEALKYWKPLYTAPQPQRQPLTAVITWLENGCDPLMAAKELRLIEAQRQPLTNSKCATIDHIEDAPGMVEDSPSAQRQPLADDELVSAAYKLLPQMEDFIKEAIEAMEVTGVIIKPDAHQLLADVQAAAHGIK